MATNNEISINSDSFLCDIQDAFSASYPFLKIAFFADTKDVDINKKKPIDPNTLVSKLLSNAQAIKINFGRNQTVSEVSYEIKNKLKVTVQVLRKSGNVWLPISLTEGWTLENQNAAGELLA
jgi:hypothetical protein